MPAIIIVSCCALLTGCLCALSLFCPDIKPDNILLDDKQTTLKLCDFGSAFKVDGAKQDPTPYLVSRFYRAPEIVLGLAYDRAVDMWSIGCCLFEMFTGQVLFPGSTNNEMLKLVMELKGKVPNKLIKKHRTAYLEQFAMEPHFTDDLKFCSRETDRVTGMCGCVCGTWKLSVAHHCVLLSHGAGRSVRSVSVLLSSLLTLAWSVCVLWYVVSLGKPILRLMDTVKTKHDLGSSLMAAKSSTDDRKLVLELRNLLERMLALDPAKRISVRDALAHPFVKASSA